MKKLSIGSWAYCFGPYEKDPVDFRTVITKLGELGMDGVEFGAFAPHPNPDSHNTIAQRQELKDMVRQSGLEFSGLAANLWMHKLLSVAENRPYIGEFEKNIVFAEDLGIDVIRVDSLEPPDVFEETGVDPKLGRERLIETWKVCCRMAADRGMEIVWEFEPGFAFNKPSEIVSIVDEMRDSGHSNFSILYDTCHAHMCAAIGARHPGEKELLGGGSMELLELLRNKIGHIHLIDSDGTLHDEETSTHNPFGKGCLDFDTLIPGILRCGCTSEWWTIDLCFWPNAWDVTEESIHFLNTMRDKYCG
jgi:sugar phosphate isomerase/epimerase